MRYLRLAKDNQERQKYSMLWKKLDDKIIEEIVKNRFVLELKKEEPFDEMNTNEIIELIGQDEELITKLQMEIQEEFEQIERNEISWIKIFERKKTEKGFRILLNFLRAREVYESRDFNPDNVIKVLEKVPDFNALKLNKLPNWKKKELYIKYNSISLIRQIDALYQLRERPLKPQKSLLKLIMDKQYAKWDPVEIQNINKWYLLTDKDRSGIEDQKKFVKIALGTPDFAILEGPPGSGKTFTICELILQLINQDKRVLLCASTHVAVDNVLKEIKDKPSIIPIRIGRDNVSEKVMDCQIDHIVFYESKKIKKRLLRKKLKGTISKSQQYLLECLQAKKSEIIKDVFLEAANVICGTTIGILNHPYLRSRSSASKETYDYLILDEASKTTFQEFLVPGMLAKKWIIVGDYKQLSPYVDAEDLEGNLQDLVEGNAQQVCTDTFECYYNSSHFSDSEKRWKKMLIIEEDQEIRELYEAQARALELDSIHIKDSNIDPLELQSSQIIIGNSEILTEIEDELPFDIYHVRGDCSFNEFLRKRSFWIKNFHPPLYENKKKGDKADNWAYQVAWRLIRENETKITKESSDYYSKQIEGLLPIYSKSVKINKSIVLYTKVENRLNIVKTIGLPSIIESLQKGVGQNRESYILSEGFDEEILKDRHVLLKYQYRMHPEISEFPRRMVYSNEALKDYEKIDREWTYKRYNHRVAWINTPGKKDKDFNHNESETENIITELKAFLRWAEHNRKDTPWEVAILTFYKAQERLIRKSLNQITGLQNRRYFNLPSKNAVIELCVVDRFQGHEADVVFLSFVQTYTEGFLNSVNRLNVALTRARYQLILFGKYGFYIRARSKILRELAEFCEDKKTILRRT